MANLRWEDRQEGRWIYVAGELDHVGYTELASRFSAAVRQAPGIVVVDMAGVTFAGSLAVTMLLEARADPHTSLFLTGMTPHLHTMLQTIGVQFYDSVRIKPAAQRVRVRLSFPNAGLKVADRVVNVEVVK